MKKFFSKILIAILMLSTFLVPVTPNANTEQKSIEFQKNEVLAQQTNRWIYTVTSGPSSGKVGGGSTETLCDVSRVVDSAFGNTTPCVPVTASDQDIANLEGSLRPDTCSYHPSTWYVCIVVWVYYVFFMPIAFLTRLSAYILDYFLFFSLKSTSYTASFIEQGWFISRDIANIFFIVALLYVALKTALSLNSSNNKKMVGMIVVIALIVNFSLFATRVVVDASNILARVFYNSIRSEDGDEKPIPLSPDGSKQITVGLVRTFDPQRIFAPGQDLSSAINTSNVGQFAIVLVISIGLMLYMIFMFFSTALVFVARVASIWILMIISPLAFVTLTIPGASKVPYISWNEWLKRLTDNALLAPLFVFFLYLIILFGQTLKEVTGIDIDAQNLSDSSGNLAGVGAVSTEPAGFTTYVSVIIPFILIFILLKTAREVTIKLSGELGSAMSKVGSMALGLAGGAVLGGAALAGSGIVGRAAGSFAKSGMMERLKDAGSIRDEEGNVIGAKKGIGAWASRRALKTVDYSQKATFDIRQTKLGGLMQSQSGVDFQRASAIGLGSQKGGFVGAQERIAQRDEKEKELYKTTMTDGQTKEYTIQRREKFLEQKADEAVTTATKPGVVLSATEITRIRSEAKEKHKDQAPKVYGKADQLNQERMVIFQDRLGQSDLLSAISHQAVSSTGFSARQDNWNTGDVKKAYMKEFKERKKKKAREKAADLGEVFDEKKFEADYDTQIANKSGEYYQGADKFDASIAKAVNDRRAAGVKMGVGIAASLATGVVGGVAASNLIGAGLMSGGAGTIAAVGGGTAAATGGVLSGKAEAQNQATQKVISNMEKESKVIEKTAERIRNVQKTLDKYSENVLDASAIPGANNFLDIKTKTIQEKDSNGNMTTKTVLDKIEKIDNKKLAEEISKTTTENDQLSSKLNSLTQSITESKNKLQKAIIKGDTVAINALQKNIERMEGVKVNGKLTGGELQDAMDEKQKINTKINLLKTLEGMEEKIYSKDKELTELTGKKSSGESAPSTSNTPPTP